MTRFGVISAYPREDWHSARLVEACRELGSVDVFEPTRFAIRGAEVLCAGRDVREWDVWLTPRVLGANGDPDFHCGIGHSLADLGIPVVNEVRALLVAEDKPRCSFLLARARVPTPPSVTVQSLEEAHRALDDLKVAVAKPPYGSLGVGVVKVAAGKPDARRSLERLLRAHGLIYLQAYAQGKDRRLFVAGGRVKAAIERTPAEGDFRANVSQGGTARPFEAPPELQEVAVRATEAIGLDYAGVDIIDGGDDAVVIEVNGTPRWEGILAATGRDMAREIVACARARALETQKGES